MGKFSNWSKEEDEILIEMIGSAKSKKWIKTSQKLRQKRYLRSPSECRERFINYLAPDIDKSEITQEELEIIYQRYEELGPKWSMIQQSVKCKTQCKIKNVFYGNIKNLLKTVYKFFTLKTAPFINSIPTDFLQVIYDGSLEFDGMQQARLGIRAMNFRNNKCALIRHIQTDCEGYLCLINAVLKEVFQQPPIECRFDIHHHRRIQKLIRREKQAEDCAERQRNSSTLVKSEEFSEFEEEQEEGEGKGEGEEEGENKREETGSNPVKVEPDAEVKVEEGREGRGVMDDGQIFPFEADGNGENQLELEYQVEPFPPAQGFFPFPFYFAPVQQ